MSSSSLCGSGGVVTGPSGATEITKWSITQTIDAVDATSFSSLGWKERVACLKGATGTFTAIGSIGTTGSQTGTFKTASAGYSISGNIIISKVTINTPVDGIVSFDHEFSFTGTITVA